MARIEESSRRTGTTTKTKLITSSHSDNTYIYHNPSDIPERSKRRPYATGTTIRLTYPTPLPMRIYPCRP